MPSPSTPPEKLAVVLDVHRLTGELPDLCPGCGGGLAIHQPDPATPDRLLATCPLCKAWFLIDGAKTSMARLP